MKKLVALSSVIWATCAMASPPPPQNADVVRARQILKQSFHKPSPKETASSSWAIRLAALKRSKPDADGVQLATRYLSDSALVIRLQAVQWLSAYARLQKDAQALPAATLQAIAAQLQDKRNFRANGEPLWVPSPSLQLLAQMAQRMETKKAKEWSTLLQSLAQKTRSAKWRAELTTFSALR